MIAFLSAALQLAIGIHGSILDQAVNLGPESITTPISRYVEGVYTTGAAVTSATVTPYLQPSQGVLAIGMTMSSYTNAATYSQTLPRPTILVEFDASIDTWATTWNAVYLTEAGFQMAPAQTSAASVISFSNLEASSWGLFWRLKSHFAYQQAYAELMARKAQQEYEAAAEIAAQLNATVDQRTASLIAPLSELYRTKVYEPVVVGGGLAGRTSFATESDRFTIRAGAHDAPLTELSSESPVEARFDDELAGRIMGSILSGHQFTGQEIFEQIAPGMEPDAALSKVRWAFAAADAVRVRFAPDRLEMRLAFARLSLGDKQVDDVVVTIPAVLSREDGVLLLDFDQDLTITDSRGAALAPADEALATEAIQAVIPPVTMELSGHKFTWSALTLALKGVELKTGELHVVLATAAPEQPSGSTAGSHLAAWCTEAGGKWSAPDAEAHNFCDCGSMWIRDDAMVFRGQASFMSDCRSYAQ